MNKVEMLKKYISGRELKLTDSGYVYTISEVNVIVYQKTHPFQPDCVCDFDVKIPIEFVNLHWDNVICITLEQFIFTYFDVSAKCNIRKAEWTNLISQ